MKRCEKFIFLRFWCFLRRKQCNLCHHLLLILEKFISIEYQRFQSSLELTSSNDMPFNWITLKVLTNKSNPITGLTKSSRDIFTQIQLNAVFPQHNSNIFPNPTDAMACNFNENYMSIGTLHSIYVSSL